MIFKTSPLLLLISSIMSAHAGLGPCPEVIKNNHHVAEAFNFLRDLEGKHQVGSCQVELHLCDSNQTTEDDEKNYLVGDMLITKNGFQRYIPFYVNEFKNKYSKQIIFNNNQIFAFRFRDWNEDQDSGRFERWDVEIFKKDNHTYEALEVGYNSEIERNSESPVYWISCGTELEDFIRNHPYKYRIRAWWWWMTHPGSW